MRIITSTSAAARLDAARVLPRRTPSRRRSHHRRRLARRGRRSGARDRAQTGRHLRPHPIQPDRTGRAGGRVASSRTPPRSRHAGRRGSRWPRARCSTRWRPSELGLLRAGRADARISRRRWRARCTSCGSPACERPTDSHRIGDRRRPIWSACWPASRPSWRAPASTIARRCFAWRPRPAARDTCAAAKLPILLLDVPLDSRAEQEFAAALVAAIARRAGDRARRRRRRRATRCRRSAATVEQS